LLKFWHISDSVDSHVMPKKDRTLIPQLKKNCF